MLTGRRPFDKGTPVATALAQVNEPPPPLPAHVPKGLRSLIERCLEKRPADRPESARELGELLGLPDDDLPEATASAESVLGAAAEAEVEFDDRPAAPPARSTDDPTPTPTSLAVVARSGHVHWAWVPVFGAAVLALAAVLFGMR